MATPFRHPTLGVIEAITAYWGPRKVWKHLYDPDDHWERIAPMPQGPRGLASLAESIIGVSRLVSRDLPDIAPDRRERALLVLETHHDRIYAPVYMAELREPATAWARALARTKRHCAWTPRGVYGVVDQGEPGHVVTAYRPHPEVMDVDMSEDELGKHGKRFFERKTGVTAALGRHVAEALSSHAGAVPRSQGEFWLLVSALGYGRAVRDGAGSADMLASAERALAAAPRELVTTLPARLGWEAALDALGTALEQDDSEDLEGALVVAEELLAVAPVVGADAAAQRFLADAVDLLAWIPAEFAHLVPWATDRAAAFDEDSLVAELWEGVSASTVGACVREGEPAIRPTARLAEEVVAFAASLRRLEAIPARRDAKVASVADVIRDGFDVRRRAKAAGSGAREGEPWVLCERGATRPPHVLMFVVDHQFPEGHAVPTSLHPGEELWEFERPGQRALVIVVVAEQTMPEGSLADVLAAAATRADIVVRWCELIRPT